MTENTIMNFFTTHSNTLIPLIIFYGSILLFFFLKRGKKLQHFFFIFYIYRTETGIKTIKKIANWNPNLWRKVGTIGIVTTVVIMVLFTTFLTIGAIHGLFGEAEYAKVVPLVPGLTIGGITFPFLIGIISIVITLVVHEGMHGILSLANKIKVKKTGIGLMGPLPFAFVEPDESNLKKAKHKTKQQIFAAGVFINIVLAIIVLITIHTVVNPIGENTYPIEGITIEKTTENSPADKANIPINTIYRTIDGEKITVKSLSETVIKTKPGEKITLKTDQKTYEITTTAREDNSEYAYIGVEGIKDKRVKDDTLGYKIFIKVRELLLWIFIVNLGVGAFNSLPIGPTDGGQMFRTATQKYFGDKKGTQISNTTTLILLGVLTLLFLNSFGVI